jgi:hypothetical protein
MVMSRRMPAPSVLSPRMPSEPKARVFTAPAARARRVVIRQIEGLQLEGDGDVEPASAGGTKGLHGGRESVEGAKEGLVDRVWPVWAAKRP